MAKTSRRRVALGLLLLLLLLVRDLCPMHKPLSVCVADC